MLRESELDPLDKAAYHEFMNEEQYDTLLNGILSLGAGQRQLTKLHLQLAQGFTELAHASAEQEERMQKVINVLRNMGDTSTDTQKRLSALEAEVAELKKKSA